MNTEWSKILEDGEILLWQGKSAPMKGFDKTHKLNYLLRIIISYGITIPLILLLIEKSKTSDTPLSFGALFVILLFGSTGPLMAFFDTRRAKKLLYAATSRRLIETGAGPVNAVPYERISQAEFKADSDGLVSLLCGSDGVKLSPASWRTFSAAGLPQSNSDEPIPRMVLYALDDPEGLFRVIKDKIPVKDKTGRLS